MSVDNCWYYNLLKCTLSCCVVHIKLKYTIISLNFWNHANQTYYRCSIIFIFKIENENADVSESWKRIKIG